MKARYIVLCLLFFPSHLFPQLPFNLFDWKLSGYIKGEAFTDTRQTTADENDENTYFPKPQIDDPTGQDINARSSTQMDAFESRVGATFSGLKMREASLSGKIEIDFEIFFIPITNVPHLRHAYGKIDWKNFSLLFGQTWHPVVFVEPKTINYNGNAPFDFYARCPQFALTYHTSKNVDIIATATSEVDFETDGPYGFSTNYIRWGVVPNFHLQCKWHINDHIMSVGGDYKRIAPRIESDTGFKVHERLNYFAAVWYLGLIWPSFEINAKVNWGQNATDYSSIGGYAVKRNSTNPITHQREYTTMNTIGLWFDFEVVKNKKLKPGVYIGFAQNLGSAQEIDLNIVDQHNTIIDRRIFGFATDVNNVFRISPRITSVINNVTLAGEVEYTRAGYGTINHYGRVINTKPAELVRCTFAAYYFF